MIPSCYLYVPGNRPSRFQSALDSGAHAIILDLEDAVAVADKPAALDAVLSHLQQPAPDGVEQWVRVNSDIAADETSKLFGLPGLTGIVMPKASPASVAVRAGLRVIALVETAAAIVSVNDIAAAAPVERLAIGEVDLTGELGIRDPDTETALWPLRMSVVVASAAATRLPPVAGVFIDSRDDAGLTVSTRALGNVGFGARQAIHPRQVTIIQEAFRPTAAERERAAHLTQLADEAGGSVCVDADGRMIDIATLRWARRILDHG